MTIFHANFLIFNQSNNWFEILSNYIRNVDRNTNQNTIYFPKGIYNFNFDSKNYQKIILDSNIIFEPGAVWKLRNSQFDFYKLQKAGSLSRTSFLLEPYENDNTTPRMFAQNIIILTGTIYASKTQIFDVKIYPTILKGFGNNTKEALIQGGKLTLENYPPNQELIIGSVSSEYHTSEAMVRFDKNSPNTILYPEWWGAGNQESSNLDEHRQKARFFSFELIRHSGRNRFCSALDCRSPDCYEQGLS